MKVAIVNLCDNALPYARLFLATAGYLAFIASSLAAISCI